MKKFMFIVFLIAIPIAVFCQQDSTAIPVPGSVIDILTNFKQWLATPLAVGGVTIFLTVLLGKLWTTMSKILKQLAAVVIAMILIIAGNLLNIGFMAEFNIQSTISYGLIIGFMANGWYDLKNVSK